MGNYSEYVIVDTRGQGQIGLLACKKCGAAIMLDQEGDSGLIHNEWHRELEEAKWDGSTSPTPSP